MSENLIYHNHHIIPKHAGGTDDASNIVKLTVAEHAEAHRILFETYGREEDRIAWLGLSGIVQREEIVSLATKLGASNGGRGNKNIPKTEEHKEKVSKTIKEKYKHPEYRKKVSDGMIGNTNSKNHFSEEYKKTQSEAMKAAWKKRKERASLTQLVE
jgi:hypothetical protein